MRYVYANDDCRPTMTPASDRSLMQHQSMSEHTVMFIGGPWAGRVWLQPALRNVEIGYKIGCRVPDHRRQVGRRGVLPEAGGW